MVFVSNVIIAIIDIVSEVVETLNKVFVVIILFPINQILLVIVLLISLKIDFLLWVPLVSYLIWYLLTNGL